MHLLVSTKLWGEASSPQFLACNLMPTIKVRYLTDGPFDKGGNEFRPTTSQSRERPRPIGEDLYRRRMEFPADRGEAYRCCLRIRD